MPSKDYGSMTIGELLTAISNGDTEAQAYWDARQQAQIDVANAYIDSHRMDMHTEALQPLFDRIQAVTEQYSEPMQQLSEMLRKAEEDYQERYAPIIAALRQQEADFERELRKASEAMKFFYDEHGTALDILSDKKSGELDKFCNDLTPHDFKKGIKKTLTTEELEQFQADRKSFFLSLTIGECIALYEYKRKRLRTLARAIQQTDNIIESLPKRMAVITNRDFQNATSLWQNGNAYLQQFKGIEDLRFKDGKLYFPGNLQPLSEMELQNLKTKEGITEIDLPLLRVFYNAILSQYQDKRILQDVVPIYVPQLAEFMGMKPNLSKMEIQTKIIAKVQSFHNVTGVLRGLRNGRPSESYYQVLNFEWYDENTNIIAFSSPYLNLVIKILYDVSVRKDKTGKPKLRSNGEPYRLPMHSYLIDSTIIKERNKAAVENVVIIVTLIEQAGNNTANIRAKTIIERNPQLQERLNASGDAGTILKRVFTKTWQLLRNKTRLTEVYEDIQLPDPGNPKNIPTMKTLDSTVFSFPHKGKRQNPKVP